MTPSVLTPRAATVSSSVESIVATAVPLDLTGGLSLRGRVVVLAGADRQHGPGIARALAAAGAQLVLCGRDDRVLWDLGGRARALGTPVVTAVGDFVHPAGGRAAVAAAMSAFGRLDVLVHNGAPATARTAAAEPASARARVNLPVLETVALARECSRVMRPGACIVNVTRRSSKGPTGDSDRAGELGARLVTRELARQLATQEIRVNALYIDSIGEDEAEAAFGSAGDIAHVSMRSRAHAPQTVAAGLVFLAGAASAGTTGLTLAVHGYRRES